MIKLRKKMQEIELAGEDNCDYTCTFLIQKSYNNGEKNT